MIPPIETATEPIRSAQDMRQRWRALMGPLGFGERLLWLGFIGADRRMTKVLSQVAVGTTPHDRLIEDLMLGLMVLLEDLPSGTSVALLLSRPGRDHVSSGDRRWAEVLTRTAERIGVPLEPIFLANDRSIEAI